MTRRSLPPRGFTLVELLVAISILAMVAVLGWRGLDGIVRARQSLTEQMETTRGMQLAFAQMQSDCEHIADIDVVQNRPYLAAEDNRLTLVRKMSTENEPNRLQVVSYRVRDGLLIRRESGATRDLVQLDALWQAAISDNDSSAPVTLQSGVSGMQVQTFENNAWRLGGPSGVGRLPPGQQATGLLPTGLQVALQVRGQEATMSKMFLLSGI
ncbi:MAG: prepilin-type N-terminal cleavage/methylation domain-containing protein [Massilia sp.]